MLLHPVLSAPPDPEPSPSAQALVEGDPHLVPLLLFLQQQQQKLKEELERRDAIIADLARRVEQLEHPPTAAERDQAVASGGASAPLAAGLSPASRTGSSSEPPDAGTPVESRPAQVAHGTAAPAAPASQPSVDLARHVEHPERELTAAELDRAAAGAGEPAPLAAGLPAGSPPASPVASAPAEAKIAQAEPGTTTAPTEALPAQAEPGSTTAPAPAEAVPAQAEPGSTTAPAPAEAVPAQADPGTTPPTPAAAAPGQFPVDEAAADRALEQSLVERGALLKPFGTAQVEPTFSYTRRELNNVAVEENGALVPANVRRDEFEGDLTFRVGLPYDSQIDVTFPYNLVDQETNTASGSKSDTGSGFGDIDTGFSKTLLRQGTWWPDLVARAFWNADTGKGSSNNVPLINDFNEVGGSLTALARKDPLAFVGSVSYQYAFEKNNDRPGNELGFSAGAFLAASPETSLRFVLNQVFIDDAKINGETIKGSDQVQSSVTIGGAVSVARGVLVDLSTDIGLTNEAPDYAVHLSVPIQFNLPFLASGG
jgi:hypothetical protein